MTDHPDSSRADRFVSGGGLTIRLPNGEVVTSPTEGDEPPVAHGLGLGTLRRSRRLTQSDVAKRMHVDQTQVSRLERRVDVRLSTLLDYLEATDAVDVDLAITYKDGGHATLPLREPNARAGAVTRRARRRASR